MRELLKSLIIISSVLSISGSFAAIQKVIYGPNDNRTEVIDFPSAEFREKAKSVAAMVVKRELIADTENIGEYWFFQRNVGRSYRLCPGERFREQVMLANCSGFLINENTLVTAGHCVVDQEQCESSYWVFDYVLGTKRINEGNVFTCKKLLSHSLEDKFTSFKDYAVIRLDRVTGREGLELRKQGRPNLGTPLVTIGHPIGLPMKITDGATVRLGSLRGLLRPIKSALRKRYFFLSNIDAYGGNSGSPVLNGDTGIVEGLLSEGAEDFEWVEQANGSPCRQTNIVKTFKEGSQEKVFRITKIKGLEEL